MSTIRKRRWTRPDGSKAEAWVCDYADQSGKRRQKTFSTKKAADAWLVNARGEVRDGTHTADSQSATLKEAAAHWLTTSAALERSTLEMYESHTRKHIIPLLGDIKLSRLTSPMVKQFYADLRQSRSPALSRKVLVSLKSLLREAQAAGMVSQNVAIAVRGTGSKRDKIKVEAGKDFPTKAEVNALLASAATFDGPWRPPFITAVFTGLRASELRGLVWDRVDFANKLIKVRQRADKWGILGPPKSAAGGQFEDL